MNESGPTKAIFCIITLLVIIFVHHVSLATNQEQLLAVHGLCSGSTCVSQSSGALLALNIQSAIPGSGSLAPWFGFVAPSHEGTDDVGITGPNGERCALSGLSIANIQVDEMDDGAKPHFVLHFGRCNQSEKATRPFEMAMMLEITTDGPCGLRQWLCDTAPPFGCHTTTTTTTFTQTSTLHLHKESFAASFQNPSLRCSGDKEHIPWATTNTKCERVTLLRHSIDSAICAYHFEDSRCYVFDCREQYGEHFGDVTFCYELLSFHFDRRLAEVPDETHGSWGTSSKSSLQSSMDFLALRVAPESHVSVFEVPYGKDWITETSPSIFQISGQPAVLPTCQLDLDVIKRDIDAGSFYPYRLQKVQTNNLLSDIDPSCSPGFCGINFKAFDFTSPFCWLKLTVLSILAGYVASYLLERLSLHHAWNWLILSGESVLSCCVGHAPGYEDLARVSQWGGSYAYAPCSACSTRAASHPSSPGHGEPHYKLEVSACKSYSPAILDVLDTILHGQPAEKNLDAFVKKLHSKRVFEEDGLVDCILTAETLHRRSCHSFNKAVRDIVWKIRFPSLILVVLVLWLTEVFNYEGLYLAEVLPALILAIFSMTLILLLRSLHPWQSAAGSKRSETARRGILLRLVIQEGQEGNQGKMGGPLCTHVAWTDEKLETLSQIALEDVSVDAEAKMRGIRKIAKAALSQNGCLLDALLHPEESKLTAVKALLLADDHVKISKLVKRAVQQDGLALEYALKDTRDASYLSLLKDVNDANKVRALKDTEAEVSALKKKSEELEVLKLAVEQNGLALCIALDVVLTQDGPHEDVSFSFFTKSELEQAVKAWRGKSFEEQMTRAEEERHELLLEAEDPESLRRRIGIQLSLILEEAIENKPDVLVKLQSIVQIEDDLEERKGEYNHLVELAKALSYSAWIKYRSYSECCRMTWITFRFLFSTTLGIVVALIKMEGLMDGAWSSLGGSESPAYGCFFGAVWQPSLWWAILSGLFVAILVFQSLPEDPWLPRAKAESPGVMADIREMLKDLDNVDPHILHAFMFGCLFHLCIAWCLCCLCHLLHWFFAWRACNHFVAHGLAVSHLHWTDFFAQACAAKSAKMAAALAAPLFFNMMTTRAAKVLPEEEEPPPPPLPPPTAAPPPNEKCYVQVVKLRIPKHRSSLWHHMWKTKRAFHMKITQKLSVTEERKILIRKTLVMHPCGVWSGGFDFNGSFWGHEKAVLNHDLQVQLIEVATGKRWENTMKMTTPIPEAMKVELQSRTGPKAILDLKLHESLPDHDAMPHWSRSGTCFQCSNP